MPPLLERVDYGVYVRADRSRPVPEVRAPAAGSKYDPLRGHLAGEAGGEVAMTFAEVENLVGQLPPSARQHRAWWANGTHTGASAWRAAGWRVRSVNLSAEEVIFARGITGQPAAAQRTFPEVSEQLPPMGPRPAPWTVSDVLEAVALAGGDAAEVAGTICDWATAHPDIRIAGGAGGIDRAIMMSADTRWRASRFPVVLYLVVYGLPGGGRPKLEIRVSEMCSTPPYDCEEIQVRLTSDLHALGIPRLDAQDTLKRPNIPLDELTSGRAERLLSVVDRWIEDVRASGVPVSSQAANGRAGGARTAGRPAELLIAAGESARVEFKETASYNAHTAGKDPAIQHAVVKTVAGFLNAQGGTLLIGVHDNGQAIGLDRDLTVCSSRRDRDGFENWLYTLLLEKIGNSEVASFVTVSFERVADVEICRVDVRPSQHPTYVGDKAEFYVRVGNSTRQYNPREAMKYMSMSTRWTNT